jgi:tRNA nucleotidyltransferase/poly(A) polymerase
LKSTQIKNMILEAYDIKKLPFYQDIVDKNGKIFQVGGAVRDLYLGKESKDLDIVITGIPSNDLEGILKKYGKVDMVGASFGVIKFTPPGGEEIDIAIPRTEKKTGAGYQGFDVSADHTLPIEKDLERRDFTINSIAKDSDGTIIDPFGGVKDLDAKLIKLTNPQAFADDPLRMLRAIQFASRFDFKIDGETFKAIQRNAMTIAEISKERVLIEFDKIVKKGNPRVGADLLVSSGLYEGIFGTEFDGEFVHFDYVTRNSEFIYWLLEPFTEQPDQYYKNVMKGDIETAREISALTYMYNNLPGSDKLKQRWVYFMVNKLSPSILNSNYVRSILSDVINDFDSQKYPVSLSQLDISGDDLMAIGLKGKAIGEMLNKLLNAVFSDKVSNNKNNLLIFAERNKDMLNESVQNNTLNKVVFYDFDGTLMDSPLPDPGKNIYREKTGKVYPHQGWWGRPESLDLNVFDIQTNPEIESLFRKDASDPNTRVVLLTNRLSRLSEPIKKILDKHNMIFDHYSFKNDGREKGERIYDILKSKYPETEFVEFYDDDIKHFQSVRDNLIETDYEFKVYHIVDGKVVSNE